MQRKRPWLADQLHVFELVNHLIALAAVAGVAARDQIFPGGNAAARTRNHMIERQFRGRQALPQYWQVLRSRSRIFLRDSARVW